MKMFSVSGLLFVFEVSVSMNDEKLHVGMGNRRLLESIVSARLACNSHQNNDFCLFFVSCLISLCFIQRIQRNMQFLYLLCNIPVTLDDVISVEW